MDKEQVMMSVVRVSAATGLLVFLACAVPVARAEVYEFGWPYPPNNLEPYAARN